MISCPRCNSEDIIKNGSVHNGKPEFICRDCQRQFVENPENRVISDETWELADRLLLEKIPIAGISRVTGISEPWLQKYINEKYENIPQKIEIVKKKGPMTIQCDEMRSFAGNKDDKYWIWPAIYQDSRKIAGVYAGSRDRKGAHGLWDSLPAVYRQCAVCYTDFRSAYGEIFPSKRHKAAGKKSGKTGYIERFNLTLRQRVPRLVRKTLSFSKKPENHPGAIWNFIHHYNLHIAPTIAITT